MTLTVQDHPITIRSHIGGDGRLQLNIPTQLTNTDLTVVVWLYPVETIERSQLETFSEWWSRKLATVPQLETHPEQDLRFEYLAERYAL